MQAQAASPWVLAAGGDTNGDGVDELVGVNQSTGLMQVWYVNGAQVTSTAVYPNLQSMSPSVWTLVSLRADFNKDGRKDILWHNPTSGVFNAWYMNGLARTGEGQFLPYSTTDPVWRVVGAANIW
ncbi:MAG: VCBS repeat-containing protein [Vicinamibacteria bacterium]|nr:VCBS repeat-containing protein [Vicinamibacteria bacterium]